ncbi:hypothetical protein OJ997_18150 [Solirubrobacter phytolaccae]|uniref:Secreted protein n=1 Tax=Solirubrobacter phytolaccae TaxID=1404360 RepID=A0A9X3N9Y3_9ACTN|nr:hypothetical protein [Solirubrobacter phytolaccae]MDA0182234.1 hypothetical protein [Solirubrobacter phytolaccae]
MRRTVVAALAVAALSAPVAAQAAEKSYVRDPLSSKLAQKPKKLNFRDVDLTGLRWIHWGQSRAIARGNASVLICEPSCAEGHRERGKVRVVVRTRKLEGDRRVYQCIEGRITGVPKAYARISWMC